MLQSLYQFLTTQLCRTVMMTLWIVNRFAQHILRIWSIVSLLLPDWLHGLSDYLTILLCSTAQRLDWSVC